MRNYIYSYKPHAYGDVTGILKGVSKRLVIKELQKDIKKAYKGDERYYAMKSLVVFSA